ncbi:MAG: hypothetical protein N2035_04740 [Chthoniobacterales bacterium]|nr:hypothetical protein [Chthoniobacterales bacterium]
MVSQEFVEIRIEEIVFGGWGLGRCKGKIWFVPYVLQGELIVAEAAEEKKDYVIGKLLKVVEENPARIIPPCQWYQLCGGCVYQHIPYEMQVALKTRQVEEIIKKIAKIDGIKIRRVVPSPKHYGYRNRVTVHIRDGKVGFFSKDRPKRVISVTSCLLADEEVNNKLWELCLRRRLRNGHQTLWNSRHKAYSGFRQVNDEVAEILRSSVTSELEAGGEVLLDAYCGCGFLSEKAASKFKEVYGIDWNARAIAAAKLLEIPNCNWIVGNVDEEIPKLKPYIKNRNAFLLLDPPESGLSKSVVKEILEMNFVKIIYVSCNPATFSRDLVRLSINWQLESVEIFDMFPQTAEIELVGFLTKR